MPGLYRRPPQPQQRRRSIPVEGPLAITCDLIDGGAVVNALVDVPQHLNLSWYHSLNTPVVGTGAYTASAVTLDVPIPAGAVAGDFLYLYMGYDSPGDAIGIGATPSGWTSHNGNAGYGLGTHVYYRSHNGSDTQATVATSGTTKIRGVIVAYSNGVPENPPTQGSWAPGGGTGGNTAEIFAFDASFSTYKETTPTAIVLIDGSDAITNTDGTQTIIFDSGSGTTMRMVVFKQSPVRQPYTILTTVRGFSISYVTTQDLKWQRVYVNNKAATQKEMLYPALIDGGAAIYVLGQVKHYHHVQPALIDGGATIYALTGVVSEQTIETALIDGGAAIYAASVVRAAWPLTVSLIDGGAAVYSVSASQTITAALINGGAAVYSVTASQTITAALIDGAAAVYGATVIKSAWPITVTLIDAVAAIYDASVVRAAYPITCALIDGGSAIYALGVAQSQAVTVDLIDGGAAIYGAAVVKAPYQIALGLIDPLRVLLVDDTFTDAGTGVADLSTHTPELGGPWVRAFGGGNYPNAGFIDIDKDNDWAEPSGFITQGAWDYGEAGYRVGEISDGFVEGRLDVGSNGGRSGLVIRQSGASYYDNFFVFFGGWLYRVTGGTITSIGSHGYSGPWYRLEVSGTNPTQITLRSASTREGLDGAATTVYSNSTAGNQMASGYVGILGTVEDQNGMVFSGPVDGFRAYSREAIFPLAVQPDQPVVLGLIDGGAAIYAATVTSRKTFMLDTLNGLAQTSIPTGSSPRAGVLTPDGTRLYFANWNSSSVTVINTADNSVVTTITGFTGPRQLVMSPDGLYVYVADSSDLRRITVASNTITLTGTDPTGAFAIAITSDGTYLYVCDIGTDNVKVYTTSDLALYTTISLSGYGTDPYGIVIDSNDEYAYVVTNLSSWLIKIRLSDNTIVGSLDIDHNAMAIGITNDDAYLFVGVPLNGTDIYTVATLSFHSTVYSGLGGAWAFGFTSDGRTVYCANGPGEKIDEIDLASLTLRATHPLPGQPGTAVLSKDEALLYVGINRTVGPVKVLTLNPPFPLSLKYTQIITAALIDGGATLYGPAVAGTAALVEPALIDGGAAIYGLQVLQAQTVTVALIDGGADIYTISVVRAPWPLTVALIDGASAIYGLQVIKAAYPITVALIDGVATIYSVTVYPDQFVTPALIDGEATVYASSVVKAPYLITLAQIDGVSAVYAIGVVPDQFISPALIDGGAAVYAASVVRAAWPVTVALIDGAGAIYAASVVYRQTITAALIDGGAAIYAAIVAQDTIVTSLIDGGATVYGLQVQPDQSLTLAHIDGGADIYTLSVVRAPWPLTLDHINAAGGIYAILVAYRNYITLDHIESVAAIYDASVIKAAYPITCALIDGGATVFALIADGGTAVAPDLIDGGATVYTVSVLPQPVTVTLDLLGADGEVYALSVGVFSSLTLDLIDGAAEIYSVVSIVEIRNIALDLIDSVSALYPPSFTLNVTLDLIDGGAWVWYLVTYNYGQVEGSTEVSFGWSTAATGAAPVLGPAESTFTWRSDGWGAYAAIFGTAASGWGWAAYGGSGSEGMQGTGAPAFRWTTSSEAYVLHPSDSSFTFATAGEGSIPILGPSDVSFVWLPFATGQVDITGTSDSSFAKFTTSGTGAAGAVGTGASSYNWTTGAGEGVVAIPVTGTAATEFNWTNGGGIGWHVVDDSVIGYSDVAFGWAAVSTSQIAPGAGIVSAGAGDTTWVMITS